MRILIAEDDPISRRMLQSALTSWHYEAVPTADGAEAWRILQSDNAPRIAILDWAMPGMDGLEVCRRARQLQTLEPPYLLLLTGRDAKADIVEGLRAGANDYITKPFNREELQARLHVGRKVVDLQHHLALRVRELEETLQELKRLQKLLPICCYCKKIRDDHNYWHQVETYLLDHTEVRFDHGICPDCLERQLRELDGDRAGT